MQRNLRRRLNNKSYPKRPKNARDVKKRFEDPKTVLEFGRNLRKTERFYVDTVVKTRMAKEGPKDTSFTIFASFQVLDMINKHIPDSERFFMLDGTFAVTPVDAGYYQLLIIFIQFNNDVSY